MMFFYSNRPSRSHFFLFTKISSSSEHRVFVLQVTNISFVDKKGCHNYKSCTTGPHEILPMADSDTQSNR